MADSREIVIKVNCGGPAVDGLAADRPYTPGGWGYDLGMPWSIQGSLLNPVKAVTPHFGYPNAMDTMRFHVGAPFHYIFDVPNGCYTVKLYMAEAAWSHAGERVFSVKANGVMRLRDLDIAGETGGPSRGLERVLTGVPVTHGKLELEFLTVRDAPVVSVIVVERKGDECLAPAAPLTGWELTAGGLARASHANDSVIDYFGTWTDGGDVHRSNVQGSAADFSFKGALVRWIGPRGADHGLAEVYLDGHLAGTVDTYAATLQPEQVLFERSGLSSDRYHTLRVLVTRERSLAANDCCQEIAAFECEQPVGVAREITDTAYAELRTIMSGGKPYPVVERWRRVDYAATAPLRGVILQEGLFKTCQDRHRQYLIDCFASPDWIIPKSTGPRQVTDSIWVPWLPGSNEGRLLAGAGHLLRWGEDAALREMVDSITAAIAARQCAGGYALPYAETFMGGAPSEMDERRAYDRSMWTRGLAAAALSGDARAPVILRRFYDWFNASPYPANMLEGSLGLQGHVASTLVALAPYGKPDDLVTAERFYVQDWLVELLVREEPLSVYKYPLNRPHCYHPVLFAAYLDHYRMTGDARYLQAARGAWNVYGAHFVHRGGSAAICEGGYGVYPPGSYWLSKHTGEFCGSVLWIEFSHRLLQLFPDEEKYAAEIEQSIYNVALANQEANGAICYHTHLHGQKEAGTRINTCCENTSSSLYAALPQYLYSVAHDGLYINLFAASSITWRHRDQSITLTAATDFPARPEVTLTLALTAPAALKLRIRVPGWSTSPMAVRLNGEVLAEGQPGSYVTLDREWRDGDQVSFVLPVGFQLRRYPGFDQIHGWDRYSLEYGPLLMAVVGPADEQHKQPNGSPCARLSLRPEALVPALQPAPGQPLHFGLPGQAGHMFVPYYEVKTGESFTCFPIIGEAQG